MHVANKHMKRYSKSINSVLRFILYDSRSNQSHWIEDVRCSTFNERRVFLIIREVPKLEKAGSEFLVY